MQTIQLIFKDNIVAEFDIQEAQATKASLINHYTKFCRNFMRHIEFDYVQIK